MKPITQAQFDRLMNARALSKCDVYTLLLKNGSAYYFADADRPVKVGGITYLPSKTLFSRSQTSESIGVEVDEMTVTVHFSDTAVLGSVYWSDAMRIGLLDGAKIKVRKAFFEGTDTEPFWDAYVFEGNVGDLTQGSGTLEIIVKSETEKFNTQVPRRMFQSSCRNTVFDPKTCKANRAAHTFNGTIGVVVSKSQFALSTAKPAGWFDNAQITFTSGENAGLSATVRVYDGAKVYLTAPLLFVPKSGDGYTIFTGCDGLLNTCIDKFNNRANYCAEPNVPVPETVL